MRENIETDAALLLVISQDNKTLRHNCEEDQEYWRDEFVSDEVIHCDVEIIKFHVELFVADQLTQEVMVDMES